MVRPDTSIRPGCVVVSAVVSMVVSVVVSVVALRILNRDFEHKDLQVCHCDNFESVNMVDLDRYNLSKREGRFDVF